MNHNKHFAVLQELRFRSINRTNKNTHIHIETCRSHPSFFFRERFSISRRIEPKHLMSWNTFRFRSVNVRSTNTHIPFSQWVVLLAGSSSYLVFFFLLRSIFWPITLLFNHIWLGFHSIFFSPMYIIISSLLKSRATFIALFPFRENVMFQVA